MFKVIKLRIFKLFSLVKVVIKEFNEKVFDKVWFWIVYLLKLFILESLFFIILSLVIIFFL